MSHVIIGTAGHVDHGKSSLIVALTERDPDRLSEEKERGITIELGFTWLDLPDGTRTGIIDVPGHERFVSNMLAGAGGIDLALLVVAADEGVMPQTREHLGILSLLGIPRGVIAITKCDLADEDFIELVEEDVRDHVKNTFLENAPIIRTSSATGEGIRHLKDVLFSEIARVDSNKNHLPFRLPVDRVFSMGGFGTVVTGTLIEGTVRTGEQVEVYPGQKKARVRGIQVHETAVDVASHGQRVALNLAGLHKDDLDRGDTLAPEGSLLGTNLLDVSVSALPDTRFSISHNMRVHLFHGAREVLARVVLLDKDILEAGDTAFAQLRTEEEVFTKYGDRFVIRFYSPLETIGGGIIVDPLPSKRKRFRDTNEEDFTRMGGDDLSLRLALAIEHGSERLDPLTVAYYRAGIQREQSKALLDELVSRGLVIVLNERVAIGTKELASLSAKAVAVLERFHEAEPLEQGMRREELRTRLLPRANLQLSDLVIDRLKERQVIDVHEGLVARHGFSVTLTAEQEDTLKALEQAFIKAGYLPPTPEEIRLETGGKINSDQYLSLLINRGVLIRLTPQILMHRDHVDEAWRIVREAIDTNGSITLAEFRDHLDASRKFAIAILEYFDKLKRTRLVDDARQFYPQKEG
ncbi:MAG: selenocysteine-specific translation elongation factor [Clostridiales bacterium]|nr:selenocysteine-specific translation elongation factor [Clostridiales bacterium]MDD3540962.1 selenocysteine-specific translation elongation factor [Eubacteriales bacterium]